MPEENPSKGGVGAALLRLALHLVLRFLSHLCHRRHPDLCPDPTPMPTPPVPVPTPDPAPVPAPTPVPPNQPIQKISRLESVQGVHIVVEHTARWIEADNTIEVTGLTITVSGRQAWLVQAHLTYDDTNARGQTVGLVLAPADADSSVFKGGFDNMFIMTDNTAYLTVEVTPFVEGGQTPAPPEVQIDPINHTNEFQIAWIW